MEAVRPADQWVGNCRHLVVTCDTEGELAVLLDGRDPAKNQLTVLSPETHDRGFAMTSSLNTMLLCTAYLLGLTSDILVPGGSALSDLGQALVFVSFAQIFAVQQ